MEYFVQQLINGITLGSIYGLIAIGYTMVYGIIGMVNFAHGDVFMTSAFVALIAFLMLTAWVGISSIALALFIVLIVAMFFTALVNWAIERVAYRPLRGSFRLAPLISAMLPPGKVIGVFTERADHMNDGHFRGVGWSQDTIKVQVQGMKPDAVFPQTYIIGREELDTDVLKAEMIEMTEAFMATCDNPGAILFECTNMCPFSKDVAAVSGLPVFDINTMINWFYRAMHPVDFLG